MLVHKNSPYLALCLCLCLTAFLVAGCGSKSTQESFLRDEVDLTSITRVAVVPFENNSKEPFAPERVRGIAITEILARGLFDVVDKGLVDSALREEAVDLSKGPMDPGAMKRLGQRLNVQAFLMGSIDQAGEVQRGPNSYPALAMTLRLIDTQAGMIFWQASGSQTGDSLRKRLFGLGSEDEFKVALRLLRQLLATISSERKVKLPTASAVAPTVVEPTPEAKPQAETVPQVQPEPAPEDTAAEEAPMGLDEALDLTSPADNTSPPAAAGQAVEEQAPAPEIPAPAALAAPDEATIPSSEDPAPATPSPPAADMDEIKPAESPAPSAPAPDPAPTLQWDQAMPE